VLLRCGTRTLDLSTPIVMGVLNVTPDSFSDGGQWFEPARAVDHAQAMIAAGAGIVDVGGESTRPGAVPVSIDEEMRRVLPVVRALAKSCRVPISVDTSQPEVMRAALDAGATIINDIRSLQVSGALKTLAESDAAVCLMHMQGEPRTMQVLPSYEDVVSDTRQFLLERLAACETAQIARNRIVIDPGIGFGKTLEHNLALLSNVDSLAQLGLPVLIGVSRKSLIGTLTGRPVEQRLAGGLAFATTAVLAGASIIRAHDVGPTVDAVKVAAALRRTGLRTMNMSEEQR